MKAIIVDDEYRGREVLAALLSTHCPRVTVAAMAGNVAAAHQVILSHRPDVVFLDVEMPDGTGFDLLEKFSKPEFKTVFVTSYDHYAIQAVRSRAYDYLVKPVLVDELKNAVARLAGTGENGAGESRIQRPVLEINHKTRLDYVPYAEILMLKGDGNYTYIYTLRGKTYHTSRVLRDYETLLCTPGSGFVRVHKSSIINLSHVRDFQHGNTQGLTLNTGEVIDVSRRKKNEVLEQLRVFRGTYRNAGDQGM